jgi:dephospho-CoA kinase
MAGRNLNRPMRVALTGGIASGKSAVSDAFAALGVPIIDADIAAREVVKKGGVGLQRLLERFGNTILDEHGELNRRALRSIIFNDEAARTEVNAILHPLIRHAMQQAAAQQHFPYSLFVIPLLLETNQVDDYDRVLVVTAPLSQRIERLCARDNIDATQAQQIIAAQVSDDKRLAVADDVIHNDGPRDALRSPVEQLHQRYLKLAQTE